ncbi:MAG: hypothetical protein IIC86_07870 [Chloroflexi bacterium]|nr:hypothetical protein [Chloroflexota bacterium]
MNAVLLIITICLYSLALIVGVKRLKGSSSFKIVLAVTDIVMTGVSLLLLGLWGIFIGIVIALVSAFIISIKSAMEFETLCTSISINGQFTNKKAADHFVRRIHKTHKSFAYIGYMGLGRIILRLSERGRSPKEIEQMAPAVNMAALAFRIDSAEVIDLVDTALRRNGRPANDALQLTDTAVKAAQTSPMTFSEALQALSEV